MKKLGTLLIGMALVLGMSQCKKNVDTVSLNNYGEPVFITVMVDNDSKYQVVTGTGEVNYTDGDLIYVGNNGKYIGTLTYSVGAFKGTIYSPSTSDFLHFYFVSGLSTGTLTPGETTSFDVNISNQMSSLHVLSYGKSNIKYTEGNTIYTCKLLNKCALVKFTLAESVNAGVSVGGMKTSATINFEDPDYAIEANNTTGSIALYKETDTEYWAILLPQAKVDDAPVSIGNKNYTVNVPEITNNAYITSGLEIDNHYVWEYHGFYINNSRYVDFAPANLQYKTGEGWRFAEKEYLCIGAFDPTDWVDLFAWGTWTGANPAHPLSDLSGSDEYTWDNADFVGDPTGHNYTWRTLTDNEWRYIVENSTKGYSTVAGVNGVVIRPHGLNKNIEATYTAAEWAAEQQENHSVFLPAAGSGIKGSEQYNNVNQVSGVGTHMEYWSSTTYGTNGAWQFGDHFGSNISNLITANGRSVRLAVRLVRDRN